MSRTLSNYKKLKDVIWYSEDLDTPIELESNADTGETTEVLSSVTSTNRSVDIETTFRTEPSEAPETHIVAPKTIDLGFLEKVDKIWIYEATDKSKVCYHRGIKDCFLLETGNGLRLLNVRIDRKGRTGVGTNRQREFTLHFVNKLNETLFTVHRPYRSLAAMLSWTNLKGVGWKVEVHDGANNLIGTVKQVTSPLCKSFDVRDSTGAKCLYIRGPLVENKMLSVKKSRTTYKIYSSQDKRVRVKLGKIEKIYYPLWKVVMGKRYRTLITFNKPKQINYVRDDDDGNIDSNNKNDRKNNSNKNINNTSTTDKNPSCRINNIDDDLSKRGTHANQRTLVIATAFLIESMLYDYSAD